MRRRLKRLRATYSVNSVFNRNRRRAHHLTHPHLLKTTHLHHPQEMHHLLKTIHLHHPQEMHHLLKTTHPQEATRPQGAIHPQEGMFRCPHLKMCRCHLHHPHLHHPQEAVEVMRPHHLLKEAVKHLLNSNKANPTLRHSVNMLNCSHNKHRVSKRKQAGRVMRSPQIFSDLVFLPWRNLRAIL